jgi:hypothetical protein
VSAPARPPPDNSTGLPAWWHAVPTGSVPARSQAGWLSAAAAAIDAADLRSDADAALRALVWTLARWADWTRPPLSRPTWPVLMEHTGRRRSWLAGRPARRCSAAQVAALIRVFLAAGWTTGDRVYALDHGRDGVARWYTEPELALVMMTRGSDPIGKGPV